MGSHDPSEPAIAAVNPTAREVTTTDGLRVAVREWPGGSPPLLMLHGLASSSHIWDFVAPRLAPEHRVVAFDQRGHGLSGKSPGGYGFEQVATDALEVAKLTRVAGPVLVGHSWGANVALEAAVMNPRRVRGLVLLDGGFHRMRDEMTWADAKARLTPPKLAGTPLGEFRQMLRAYVGNSLKMTPPMEAVFLSYMRVDKAGRIRPQLSLERHLRILRAIWEQDTTGLLRRLRVPTLMLLAVTESPAEAGFVRSKKAAAAGIRELSEHIQLEWIKGIHDAPLQRPTAVATRIGRFVSSLPS